MDLHRGTKHKTLATRASHTLYFDTILLTNGGPTTRCPLLSPRHHSCDRSRFPLGGHLINEGDGGGSVVSHSVHVKM